MKIMPFMLVMPESLIAFAKSSHLGVADARDAPMSMCIRALSLPPGFLGVPVMMMPTQVPNLSENRLGSDGELMAKSPIPIFLYPAGIARAVTSRLWPFPVLVVPVLEVPALEVPVLDVPVLEVPVFVTLLVRPTARSLPVRGLEQKSKALTLALEAVTPRATSVAPTGDLQHLVSRSVSYYNRSGVKKATGYLPDNLCELSHS